MAFREASLMARGPKRAFSTASLQARARARPPPIPAREMGGPERRGAVSSRGRKKSVGAGAFRTTVAFSGRRLRGQGVFPFRVQGPRATLGYSARSAPRFREASARRRTGAGGVASRGSGRGSPPVPANRAPPTPPDPSEGAPCGGSGRRVGKKSDSVKRARSIRSLHGPSSRGARKAGVSKDGRGRYP
jgi:hypothetical protein